MPLPFFHSTTGVNAYFGMAYTRLRGLVLSGTLGTTQAGPIEPVGGVALIQPALVCSTAGAAAQIVSTAAAAISAANYVYIPQTTGGIATSSFAAGQSAPPQTGMGAALIWDAGTRRLGVYSTASGTGFWAFSNTGITTSAGAGGFTSS